MNGTPPTTIDTTGLLTILGVVAAVWAVIPATARLSFRLCMSRWDWAFIWTIIASVHILVFEDVLRALHVYPNLGPWLWNLEKNGAIYLLFLTLTTYIYLRSRSTRLSRRNLPLFERLVTALLHTRKFAELGELLDRHLETVIDLEQKIRWRDRLASWIRPPAAQGLAIIARGLLRQAATPASMRAAKLNRMRSSLASFVGPKTRGVSRARNVIKASLSSRDLVSYLALAHPYFCLRVMARAEEIVDDFQDMYFEALLANDSSILFFEIKNNDNLAGGGHRLRLPPENRLLNFYLKDVSVAADLGVYRSVGEALLSRIESDDTLSAMLNRPMQTYDEVGKLRCPVYCGLYFFRIMVLEGLHQRVADHLWLHYVTHIVDRILSRARPLQEGDENHEFATRFCYLLYQVVDATMDWIEEAEHVSSEGDALTQDQLEGRHAYISFEAAGAIGGVMQSILRADNLTDRLKDELLSVVLSSLKRLERKTRLAPLARAVEQSIVLPYGFRSSGDYLATLQKHYEAQDHVLRRETTNFADALAKAEGKG